MRPLFGERTYAVEIALARKGASPHNPVEAKSSMRVMRVFASANSELLGVAPDKRKMALILSCVECTSKIWSSRKPGKPGMKFRCRKRRGSLVRDKSREFKQRNCEVQDRCNHADVERSIEDVRHERGGGEARK
eukprot:6181838-Pleurochrysis_carterae.AAC.1